MASAGGPAAGKDRDPTRGRTAPNLCWTLTNMQEATPDVLTPMCWSMWTPLGELGARRAWYDLGIVPRSMVLDGTGLPGRELLRQSRDRLLTAATVHGTSRFLTQAVQGALGDIAAMAGRPELATRVYGGFGR